VLLGIIHTNSNREISYDNIEDRLGNSFTLVKRYNLKESWEHLKAHNEHNREGYIIRYSNGFRMKVKFEDYVRLHRIITNISTVDVWEALRDEKALSEILDKVPDEFYDWVRSIERELRAAHEDLLWQAHEVYEGLVKRLGDAGRKEYALALSGHHLSSIVFRFLDGRRADDIAWKMVKPKWSKPFFKQNENS
jgi:RNA ligase